MVTKPTEEDMVQAVRNSKVELLMELEQCILESEAMDSPMQHTLKRIQAQVIAIYSPLDKQFEDTLE